MMLGQRADIFFQMFNKEGLDTWKNCLILSTTWIKEWYFDIDCIR